MECFIYILTFSLQFTGIIILADKLLIFTKENVVKQYTGNSKVLVIKDNKVKIDKSEYFKTIGNIVDVLFGTVFTIIGQCFTLYDANPNITLINKISYSVTIIVCLLIILFIIKKIILFFYEIKYKNTEQILVDKYQIEDGTLAVDEVDEWE